MDICTIAVRSAHPIGKAQKGRIPTLYLEWTSTACFEPDTQLLTSLPVFRRRDIWNLTEYVEIVSICERVQDTVEGILLGCTNQSNYLCCRG